MRKANGILAGILVLLFFCHAALSAGRQLALLGNAALVALMWLGLAGAVVHACLSIATSYSMLTSTQRPPSTRKKRHLLWKWLSGAALLACMVAHAFGMLSGLQLILALVVFLGIHSCLGAKSFLKDVGISRRFRRPLQVVLATVCALVCLALVL